MKVKVKMLDILSQEPVLRVSADPGQVIKNALARSSYIVAGRFGVPPSAKIVLAKLDGAICDQLTLIANLVAPEESAIIDTARKSGEIDKAQQIYLHFYVLLKIRRLDMKTLTEMVAKNFAPYPGVHALREKLLQIGVGLVAVSNGMGVFLREALKHNHLDLPVICNELVFASDGQFEAIEVVHDPAKLVDQARVVQTLRELGAVTVGCIGDGPSDIAMAKEVSDHGGHVLSCGAHSPLTEWCQQHLMAAGFNVYERSYGFTKKVRAPLIWRADHMPILAKTA